MILKKSLISNNLNPESYLLRGLPLLNTDNKESFKYQLVKFFFLFSFSVNGQEPQPDTILHVQYNIQYVCNM